MRSHVFALVLLPCLAGRAEEVPPVPAEGATAVGTTVEDTIGTTVDASAPATTDTAATTDATTTESTGNGADSAPAEESPPVTLETSITGYADSRWTYTHAAVDHLLPSRDVATLSEITEGNLQIKLRWGDRGMAYADASFFHQAGTGFVDKDSAGKTVDVDDHDVAALRPQTVISEAYGTWNLSDHARFTLGKKRIVWGPGFAQNPTDLLNPAKDPTDPTFQRAGSWLGWLEFPFETWTLSVVGAAKTLRQYGGIPSALLVYPEYPTVEATRDASLDDRDDDAHYTAAARAYFLWNDTDINLFYFRSNKYNDAFSNKDRAGFSLSRVWGEWEFHVEALAQTGSSRIYANADCVKDLSFFAACARSGTTIAARDRLDDSTFRPRVLTGARWTLNDNGLLSIEHSYLGDGYSDAEFRNYVSLVRYGRDALAALPAGAPRPSIPGQQVSDPGSPQKFSFDPLRRHYAFITWQQPQIRDDFTLSATVLLNLHDLSGQVASSVTWSAREWLNLTAGSFVVLPGVDSLSADVGGARYSEYGLLPNHWRGYVSARAFF